MTMRNPQKRNHSLSDLAQEILGDNNYKSEFCLWCGSKQFKKGRRRYCDDDCTASAHAYCFPHDVGTKAYILMERQDFSCRFCGLNVEHKIDKFIPKQVKRNIENNKRALGWGYSPIPPQVTYFQIGNHISGDFDLDHIIPIHKGGSGIGFDNLQVICKACHKIKTSKDRKKLDKQL